MHQIKCLTKLIFICVPQGGTYLGIACDDGMALYCLPSSTALRCCTRVSYSFVTTELSSLLRISADTGCAECRRVQRTINVKNTHSSTYLKHGHVGRTGSYVAGVGYINNTPHHTTPHHNTAAQHQQEQLRVTTCLTSTRQVCESQLAPKYT